MSTEIIPQKSLGAGMSPFQLSDTGRDRELTRMAQLSESNRLLREDARFVSDTYEDIFYSQDGGTVTRLLSERRGLCHEAALVSITTNKDGDEWEFAVRSLWSCVPLKFEAAVYIEAAQANQRARREGQASR